MSRLGDLLRRVVRREPVAAPACAVDPVMRRVEAYEATARDLVARMTPEERQQLQAQLRRQRREHVHAEAAIEYRDIAVQGRDFWPW